MSNPARPAPKMTIDEYFRKYGVFSDLVSTNILIFEDLYKSYYDQYRSLIYEIVQIDGIDETPSVDETFLKYCIFIVGKATFFREKDGTLRALNGTYSGVPDIYYIPELMIVTNPRLTDTYELKRGEDCEVVYCREVDRYNIAPFGGLFPLISETATIIADNKISINVAQKNTRLINLISADTEQAKRSVESVIANMYAGLPFGCIQSSLVDEIRSIPLQPNTTNRYLIDLIQLEQYALSHFYEKIGLYTHDQMKKERLITAEINDNANLPIFNIYNIIKTINEGFNRVNAMFGTHYKAYINPLILDQIESIPERKEVAAETEEGVKPNEVSPDGISEEENAEEDAAASESESDPPDAANDDDGESARSTAASDSDEDRDETPPDESEEDPEAEDEEDADAASEEPEDDAGIDQNIEINIEIKAGDEDGTEGQSEEMDGDNSRANDESVDAVRGSTDADRSDAK